MTKLGFLVVVMALMPALPSSAELSPTDAALLDEILEMQGAGFSRMQTIQYTCTLTFQVPAEVIAESTLKDVAPSTTNACKFVGSGANYLSEVCAYTTDPSVNKTITRAFNSSRYQYRGGGQLAVSSQNANDLVYGTVSPLVHMYYFAIGKGENNAVHVLAAPGKWAALKGCVVSITAAEMLGHKGYTITFVGPSGSDAGNNESEVFFAQDLNYYPMYRKTKLAGVDRYSVSQVSVTKSVSTDRGDVVVPMHIEAKSYFKGNLNTTSTVVINPDSLKINATVDSAVFTLVPAKGERYIDLDQGLNDVVK